MACRPTLHKISVRSNFARCPTTWAIILKPSVKFSMRIRCARAKWCSMYMRCGGRKTVRFELDPDAVERSDDARIGLVGSVGHLQARRVSLVVDRWEFCRPRGKRAHVKIQKKEKHCWADREAWYGLVSSAKSTVPSPRAPRPRFPGPLREQPHHVDLLPPDPKAAPPSQHILSTTDHTGQNLHHS